MKARPMYRVWLSDEGKMDSSPDIMVNAHGEIFGVVNSGEVIQLRIGTVMLNTGIERQGRDDYYELDMVICDDSVGFIVMVDGAARVWFGPDDIEYLDDIDVEFIGIYWNALYDEQYADFKTLAESFPIDLFFRNM